MANFITLAIVLLRPIQFYVCVSQKSLKPIKCSVILKWLRITALEVSPFDPNLERLNGFHAFAHRVRENNFRAAAKGVNYDIHLTPRPKLKILAIKISFFYFF